MKHDQWLKRNSLELQFWGYEIGNVIASITGAGGVAAFFASLSLAYGAHPGDPLALLAWLAMGGIWLAYFTCWLAGSGPAAPGPDGEAQEQEIRRNAFFRVPAVFLFAGVMIAWFTVFALVVLSLVIAWDVAPARAVFAGAGGLLLVVATFLFTRTAFALPAWALNHKGGPRRAWAMTGRIGAAGIARVWALLTAHIVVFAALFIAIRGFLLPTPWLWTELAVHGLLTAVAYTGLLTVMMLTTLAYRDARGLPIRREPAPPEKPSPPKSP